MKKIIFISLFSLILAGCGVGTYSVQSGVEDASYLSFTDDVKQEITVNVDDKTYTLETVKTKAYKSGRNIKMTALNTIKLPPGQHDIKVMINGSEVYSHKVFISAGETKIVEL